MAAYSYCFKCSVLLREKDFAKGKAFKVGENVACAACAGDVPRPPAEKKRDTAARPRPTSVRVKAVESPEAPTSSASRRKWALVAAIAVIGVGVAILLPLFAPREKPAEPPPVLGGGLVLPHAASARNAPMATQRTTFMDIPLVDG